MSKLHVSRHLSALLLVFQFLIITIDSYRILGVLPTNSKSHYKVGNSLMQGLAAAGHNVTVISPFVPDHPIENYRAIQVEDSDQHWPDSDYFSEVTASHLVKARKLMHMSNEITNHTLRCRAVSALLAAPDEHFDVIVMEVFLNEAMVGLGHHFSAPIVAYSTIGTTKSTSDMVGSPSPLSYIPHCMLPFTEEMNFVQRMHNTLVTAIETIVFHCVYLPLHERLYDDIFADPKPTLAVARTNISLVLLNTHFSLSFPRPYMVNMIEVGGMHINRAPNKLPAKIQRFLDGAKHGAVLFSMGSMVKMTHLPPQKRQALLRVFAGLKQRVIWKWEQPDLPDCPDNVMIGKWLPQEDILAHRNVKVFISHAGLLSMTESIYHGVPLVGIPLGSDQNLNMARVERAGYGVKVNFANLSAESLDWAVKEVLHNSRYREQVKLTSVRYRDQLKSPLETAIYWVEYVARHKGAPHLHSASLNMSFMSYHNIDVFAVLSAAVVLTIFLAMRFLYLIIGSIADNCGGSFKHKTN